MEALGPAAVEELVRLIGEDPRRQKRFRRFLLTIYLPSIILVYLMSIFLVWRFPQSTLRWGLQLALPLFNLIFIFGPLMGIRFGKAAKILAEQDDIRIVGALAEACVFAEAQGEVLEALLRLLPQMKASDTHLLNADQKEALYKVLNGGVEPLVLAILKSLEQIGDGGALPYVEKLANPPKNKEVSEEVQEAAQACLPFLTERAQEENNRSTLLRASEPTTQPDELLRPVTATAESDPNVLLRAAQVE
jgi:hypothetical protein